MYILTKLHWHSGTVPFHIPPDVQSKEAEPDIM